MIAMKYLRVIITLISIFSYFIILYKDVQYDDYPIIGCLPHSVPTFHSIQRHWACISKDFISLGYYLPTGPSETVTEGYYNISYDLVP